MIAHYIHWTYPPTADDANYYAGQDDDKLFHHKENAEKYAREQLEEWRNIAPISYGDLPDDYIICERDIKFEDEL